MTINMDAGSIAWLLTASALVLFMTPGLAFFYGGLVRAKNVLNLMMQCFMVMGLVSITWVLWGYSIAFGPTIGGFIGNPTTHLGLNGIIGAEAQSFAMFQMMFAIITPALIVGAVADRFKFTTLIVFVALWSTLVYSPIAHWVWASGGWLFEMGALDFAGGTVVHISSGFSALVAAILVGKRSGKLENFKPHNIPYVLLGTGILWFGWFGFNAGSSLAADGIAVNAFLVTNTSAAAGALMMMFLSMRESGKPSAVMTATGAVAGLVAITPASGFVGPVAAILIGAGVGLVSWFCIKLKNQRGWDDSLDVWAVHGMGGLWGAIATGLFASAAYGVGVDGLFSGGPISVVTTQIVASVASIAYAGIVTFVLLKILDSTLGLRVDSKDEEAGMDISVHAEEAYN
ncbi:MAG: ammonium transporter [Nitrososphaerales archaeon]